MAAYEPRFFSAGNFEGLVAIIETMIDPGNAPAASPRLAAERVDTFLSRIDSPDLEAVRLAIGAIDSWYLPLLLAFKFGRFRQLPLADRRRVVQKIIEPQGLFAVIALVRAGARDAARTLKLLSSVGYYSSPAAMAQVGYLPVDARPRFAGLNQAPLAYPDPFPQGDQP
jgi:hypothetical protein